MKDFLGIDSETAAAFWRKCLELYLGATEELLPVTNTLLF